MTAALDSGPSPRVRNVLGEWKSRINAVSDPKEQRLLEAMIDGIENGHLPFDAISAEDPASLRDTSDSDLYAFGRETCDKQKWCPLIK